MNGDDFLLQAAYHSERVASRRLAKRAAISEEQALMRVLHEAAGPAGLAHLLATRTALRQQEQARKADKAQQRQAQRAARLARYSTPAHAWCGWFDGSAHPNPGRLGLGAVLAGPDGAQVDISRRGGYGNSSEAEYAALIALLQVALHWQPAELVIHGDSRVVIDDVNQRHTGTAAAGLGRQRADVAALLAQFSKVTLKWIPRIRNGAADRLAQLAIASWQDVAPAAAPAIAGEIEAGHEAGQLSGVRYPR